MSSCQPFFIPVAEGGAAVGMDPTPTASFIKLEIIFKKTKWSIIKLIFLYLSHIVVPFLTFGYSH